MRYQRCADVTAEMAGDRVMLLDGSGTELLTLNEVGTMVWEKLDRSAAIAEIVEHVARAFDDVSPELIENDVETFLSELVELSVIDVSEP